MTDIPLLEGRVRIGREIGRGGFGVVYRGEWVADGRAVAVKILEPGIAADDDRLRREASLLAALDHPRLVGFLGLFVANEGRRALVYDLVEGRTLSEIGAEREDLPVADWLGQMGEALDVLHDAGLVHRDIKPDNVMVQPDGSLRLLDYGLLREAGPGGTLTQEGILLGTPLFMAPELLRGERATAASDLYALGCVGYWMLEREHAFPAPDPAMNLMAKQAGAPRSATAAGFFRCALHPDPSQRFESGKAMATGFLSPEKPVAATVVLGGSTALHEAPAPVLRPVVPSTTRRMASWGRPLALAGAGLFLVVVAASFFLAGPLPVGLAPPVVVVPEEEARVPSGLEKGQAIVAELVALERRFFPPWAPEDANPLEAAVETRVISVLFEAKWSREWRHHFAQFVAWSKELSPEDRDARTGEVLWRGSAVLSRMATALRRYGNPVANLLGAGTIQGQMESQQRSQAIENSREELLEEVKSLLAERGQRPQRWFALDISLLRVMERFGERNVAARFWRLLEGETGLIEADVATHGVLLELLLRYQVGLGKVKLAWVRDQLEKLTPGTPRIEFQLAIAKICNGILLERVSGQALDLSTEAAVVSRLLTGAERQSTWPGHCSDGLAVTLNLLRRQDHSLAIRLRRLTDPVFPLGKRLWPRLPQDPRSPEWRLLPSRLRWDLFRCRSWRYDHARKWVAPPMSLEATIPFLEGVPASWARIEPTLPSVRLLREWAMAGGNPLAVPEDLAKEIRTIDTEFAAAGLFRPGFPFAYLAGFDAEGARPNYADAGLPVRATGSLGYAYQAIAEAERSQGAARGQAVFAAVVVLLQVARSGDAPPGPLLALAGATLRKYGIQDSDDLSFRGPKYMFELPDGRERASFLLLLREFARLRSGQ